LQNPAAAQPDFFVHRAFSKQNKRDGTSYPTEHLSSPFVVGAGNANTPEERT
jgi:hypothetical protein